ncbi:MAG: hypothetical protein ABSB18_07035 [Candidatus Omnitrophota bacterium]
MEKIFLQFLTLGIYVLFMGFCFCDFFKLNIRRKLLWFLTFLFIAVYVFKTRNDFDLGLILPLPTLLAMMLGWMVKKKDAK